MKLQTIAKYAVGSLLFASVSATAFQNIMSKKAKEPMQSFNVDYGRVGDTIRYNTNGDAVLTISDSVKVSPISDIFVRTGKDTFDHLKYNIESIRSGIDSLGIVNDTICLSDKPISVSKIKGKLSPIRTILLSAK